MRHNMRYYLGILAVMLIGLSARAATHYVVPPETAGATPANPYTSWGTAGTSINDVVKAAMTNTPDRLVLVTNGTYYLTNMIVITNGLTLRSFHTGSVDVAGTVLNGNWPNTTNRCFYMSTTAAGAVIDGFTITNGCAAAESLEGRGGGIYLSYGIVTNCVITGNQTPTNGNGGGVYMGGGATVTCSTISGNLATNIDCVGGGVYFNSGGVVTNCLISTNRAFRGGGAYMNAGGLLINCTIANNVARPPPGLGGAGGMGGGGSVSQPGMILGCTIASNYAYASTGGSGSSAYGGGVNLGAGCLMRDCLVAYNVSATYGGGLNMAGTVSNCVIRNNSATSGGSFAIIGAGLVINSTIVSNSNAMMIQNGTNRNCLIAYNSAGIWVYPGFGGYFQNCTVVSNGSGFTFSAPAILENCIVYYNGTTGTNYTGSGVWTNSCTTPMPTGTYDVANITNAPQFADSASGNFRLSANSPCINRGVNCDWMTNNVDLDGRMRIRYGTVDMGAYEAIYDGTIFRIP